MLLILASRSKARRALLDQAGLRYECLPADIDEGAVQDSGLPPAEIAARLAREKALAVSRRQAGALVLGGDQVLEYEGRCLAKAPTPGDAQNRLAAMRGRSHRLISGAALAKDGAVLWESADTATLHMADISDDMLVRYCRRAGSALTETAGGYEIESLGISLFERIEGDYFTILGLPLLPVLNQLRTLGITLP